MTLEFFNNVYTLGANRTAATSDQSQGTTTKKKEEASGDRQSHKRHNKQQNPLHVPL